MKIIARHCDPGLDPGEATQTGLISIWVASSLSLLAMTMSLCGCDSIGELFEPPAMLQPVGTNPTTIPPQDNPALEKRAAEEREDLPQVPPPADPETYSYLGSVPKKPVMPTEAEIAGQVKELAAEETAGSAIIAQQAEAPEAETLPKAQTEPTTHEQVQSPSQDEVFSGNANPFLPQSQMESTDRLPADAP